MRKKPALDPPFGGKRRLVATTSAALEAVDLGQRDRKGVRNPVGILFEISIRDRNQSLFVIKIGTWTPQKNSDGIAFF